MRSYKIIYYASKLYNYNKKEVQIFVRNIKFISSREASPLMKYRFFALCHSFQKLNILYILNCIMCTGGQGFQTPPLQKSQNIGFLNSTGPDPLKIAKLPSQHSI